MKGKKGDFDIWHLLLILCLIALILFVTNLLGNYKALDTDGDGLSDEEEEKWGTDLINPNTDGDRYKDGEEIRLGKNPLIPNNAKIKIYLVDKSWNWASVIVNTVSLIFKVGSLSSETVIADTYVKILVKNEGDDYSSYVNYNLIYEVSGYRLRDLPISLGTLKEEEEKILVYKEKILLKDVPDLLINSILTLNAKWEIKFDNLNYEKF